MQYSMLHIKVWLNKETNHQSILQTRLSRWTTKPINVMHVQATKEMNHNSLQVHTMVINIVLTRVLSSVCLFLGKFLIVLVKCNMDWVDNDGK